MGSRNHQELLQPLRVYTVNCPYLPDPMSRHHVISCGQFMQNLMHFPWDLYLKLLQNLTMSK